MGLSANKGDIRDTGGKFIFSITGATKKEKTMDEKHLADNYKNLIGKSVVKSESLKLTSDVTAKTLKLFEVGAETIYHLHNGDEKCQMGCAYLHK